MSPLLLATDFDGTLAAIVDDPSDARADAQLAALLQNAARREDVVVAVVSGRDVEDLAARVPLENVWYAGSHGREIRRPDGSWLVRSEPMLHRPPASTIDSLRGRGFRIEEKKFGLAIHWRALTNVEENDPLLVEFREWARDAGLEMIEGRKVAEARAPGADKRAALERIAHEVEPERVAYAGDDLTDFEALRWAAENGHAFFLASRERRTPAIEGMKTLRSRAALLEEFARILDQYP